MERRMSGVGALSLHKILCVGHVCVDMINICSSYPEEDSKIGTTTKTNRCLDQRWQRGGNASNNCTVLGLLGAKPTFFGTIADSPEKRFLLEDFAKFDVNTDYAVIHEGCDCPASCIILSAATGSRTIVHANKNLPEVSVEDFDKIDLSPFKWVHFEGRNVPNVTKMIDRIRQHNKNLRDGIPVTISVEIEKAKPELESLISLPDVLFVSKDYAMYKGYRSMQETLEKVQAQAFPKAVVICPWGEEGASASSSDGNLVHSPAFPPVQVIDTLGAGDTFNAATIFSLSSGRSLKDSITFGCRIAGLKVGVAGWEALRKFAMDGAFSLLENSVEKSNVISVA
ncbi:ketohexokinase isoform X2 [Procambarus clarkii]|uniref:ketohexokinase isoform X2 n=1 Tax=Procambarus clarkii TaxID=6728 RepID=UPI001E677420|nr:ketohexokinase-like isoform X1 [Procambarus clarkii]